MEHKLRRQSMPTLTVIPGDDDPIAATGDLVVALDRLYELTVADDPLAEAVDALAWALRLRLPHRSA